MKVATVDWCRYVELSNLREKNLNKVSLALLLTFTVVVSLASLYLHLPEKPPLLGNHGFKYSDIVYGVYGPIFLDIVSPDGTIQVAKVSERWFNQEKVAKLVSRKYCPIPYKDYKFEYPPIVAALWTLSTCIPIAMIFPEEYTASEYYLLAKKAVEIHYYIQSFFIIIAFVATVTYLYKLALILNRSWMSPAVFIILPSTVLYLIYNWDIISSAFLVAAAYYLLSRKYLKSGLLLGLSISTKLLPIVYAIVIVYDMMQKVLKNREIQNDLALFVLGLIATGLMPYIVVLTTSYKGFMSFIEHHMQWYCENCIYMYITQDVFSQYNRVLAMVFVLVSIIILLAIDIDYSDRSQHLRILLASMIVSTALNYVFSPQMMLLITPIAVLALDVRQLLFLVIADAANFGIMSLFFKDLESRVWLAEKVGLTLPVKYSPWSPDSPVQMLAMIRNVILILILIDIMYHMFNLGSRAEEKRYYETLIQS